MRISSEMQQPEVKEIDGRYYQANTETGEVEEVVCCWLPIGTIFFTPEEQRRRQEREEQKESLALNRDAYGKYIYVDASARFNDLGPEAVARLFFLASYMTYKRGLYIEKKKPITSKNLKDVLEVSDNTASTFLKKAAKYIEQDADGNLTIKDNHVFLKQRISNIQSKKHRYVRLYIESYRRLYKRNTNKKYIGYVLEMIGSLQISQNAFCRNPREEDPVEAQYMTMKEFCEKVGSNAGNPSRMKSELSSLRFVDRDGNEAPAVLFSEKDDIFIHPGIIFNGWKYYVETIPFKLAQEWKNNNSF